MIDLNVINFISKNILNILHIEWSLKNTWELILVIFKLYVIPP